MDIIDIRAGTKLKLQLFEESQETFGKMLPSSFEGSEKGNIAIITAPMKEGNIYPVHVDTLIDLYFIKGDKSQQSDLYRVTAKVVSRGKKDNIEYLKVKLQGEIQKIQRRQYYRLDCTLPIWYRLLDKNDSAGNKENKFKEGTTKNFSGGGLCIVLNEEVNINELIECEFKFAKYDKIRFRGKIIRVDNGDFRNKKEFEAAVVIVKINEKQREEIVKYIFKEQLELRKKGLI
jgi:c-di-GMP-binding flagellar brake protein YcgR